MTSTTLQPWLAVLTSRVGPAAAAWVDAARHAATLPGTNALLTLYTSAAHRVGRARLDLLAAERAGVAAEAPGIVFDHWTLDDAARVVLLAARREAGRTGEAFVADAVACHEQGDAREQQSWLRAASLWPEAEALRPTVIDACRTNIVPVFEAVACENPFPARWFPERPFNQVVLKALFNGIAMARIVGLRERLNAELTRMARDYAAERTAAGRSVPADIAAAMEPADADQETPR